MGRVVERVVTGRCFRKAVGKNELHELAYLGLLRLTAGLMFDEFNELGKWDWSPASE